MENCFTKLTFWLSVDRDNSIFFAFFVLSQNLDFELKN